MLEYLKKKIENNNFKNFTNVEIKYDELIISASEFTGYDSIKEQVEIAKLIDENKFKIEYLNNNIIKIKLK
jgi:hypothetical protein